MGIVLGIESSCDETAAALVDSERRVIAQRIASQDDAHRPYGGVVPEIAARAHAERVTPLVAATLADAGMTLDDVDAIAATAGPGLIGGVMVGLVSAKALAMASGKPLIAVNHLEGHALSPRLADSALQFPYLLLLVSGGHCQLLLVEGVGRYKRLGTTIDDALGEAFDKTAKILGLGFPGGPAVERLAREGDARKIRLPRPLLGSSEPHFSFAGLKSAVLRAKEALDRAGASTSSAGAGTQGTPSPALEALDGPGASTSSAGAGAQGISNPAREALDRVGASTGSAGAGTQGTSSPARAALDGPGASTSSAGAGTDGSSTPAQAEPVEAGLASAPSAPPYSHADIAASFQQAAIDCVIDRTRKALQAASTPTALVVAGGVAANQSVRSALEGLAAEFGLPFVAPPLALCTDNAAMIAWAGIERLGQSDPLDFAARPRWPLDPDAAPVRGAGVKA